MSMQSQTHDFLDAYRTAFEAFDALALAELFSYPCQLTSNAGRVDVMTISARDAWLAEIERLLDAYRAIGFRSAQILERHVIELTPGLAQATVHWRLVDEDGETIYEFDASYTLADFGDGLRITAIAHNESLRLRATLERRAGNLGGRR